MKKLLFLVVLLGLKASLSAQSTDFDTYQEKLATASIPFTCCIYNVDKLPKLDKDDFLFFCKGYSNPKFSNPDYELRSVGKFTVDDAHIALIVNLANVKTGISSYILFAFSNEGNYRDNKVLGGSELSADGLETTNFESYIDKNQLLSKHIVTKDTKSGATKSDIVEYWIFDTNEDGDLIFAKGEAPKAEEKKESKAKSKKSDDDDDDDDDDE